MNNYTNFPFYYILLNDLSDYVQDQVYRISSYSSGFEGRSLYLVFWQRLTFKNQSEGKAYRRERDKEKMEILTVAPTKDKKYKQFLQGKSPVLES